MDTIQIHYNIMLIRQTINSPEVSLRDLGRLSLLLDELLTGVTLDMDLEYEVDQLRDEVTSLGHEVEF